MATTGIKEDLGRSSERDWGSLDPDLVDHLVEVLKQTRYWNRCGRVLRALNRHWCNLLNGYIHAVRSHRSKDISLADVQSLLKFQNVSSVDLTEFLKPDQTGAQLCDVLGRMQKLRQIEIQYGGDLREVPEGAMSRLTGVTSLVIGNFEDEWTGKTGPACLKHLPLKRIRVAQTMEHIPEFFNQFQNLQHLSVLERSLVLTHLSTSGQLTHLESLELNECCSDVAVVSELKNLTSLGMVASSPEMNWIPSLPRLEKLRLFFYREALDQFTTLSITRFAAELVSLSLACSGQVKDIDFAQQMPKLERLSCGCCRLRGSQLRDNFPSLTSLSLTSCDIDEKKSFLEALRDMKSIRFHFISITGEGTFEASFEQTVLPRVERLVVNVNNLQTGIRQLSTLVTLDTLCLLGAGEEGAVDDLYYLTSLTNLRVLGCLWCEHFKASEILDLPMLTELEAFLLDPRDSPYVHEGGPIVEGKLKALKMKNPGLKLIMGETERETFLFGDD